jgi:hypothetical protein
MDISETTAPKSDQQNYDDYAGGIVRIVTVTEVKRGGDEQPVDIHLAEFPGRPYRPSKSMRRVLMAAWGRESSVYVGRRMELYGDPDVTFGRDKVGGIKISRLSHVEKRLSVALTVTRGKRAPYVVEPLPPVSENDRRIAALRAEWNKADTERRKSIEAEVAALTGGE